MTRGSSQDPTPVVWSPRYEVDIGPHVFPTVKYRKVRERLLEDGLLTEADFVEPEPATWAELERVHTREYLEKIRKDDLSPSERRILEVPFSADLREASVLCAGGTIRAAELALANGVGIHLGGGFHHAFPGHGEGFCLLNDVAVAVRALQDRRRIRRAAVIDLDVHQGNGTAEIFRAAPEVFTFSMHQEWNYPTAKPPSDLDVGLEDGVSDDRYLELLELHLSEILDEHGSELVLYVAGADPYHEDQLGGLALSMEGLRERDRTVFQECRRRGIPVAMTPAGGYALREDDTVEIHRNTIVEALEAAGATVPTGDP